MMDQDRRGQGQPAASEEEEEVGQAVPNPPAGVCGEEQVHTHTYLPYLQIHTDTHTYLTYMQIHADTCTYRTYLQMHADTHFIWNIPAGICRYTHIPIILMQIQTYRTYLQIHADTHTFLHIQTQIKTRIARTIDRLSFSNGSCMNCTSAAVLDLG